MASIFRKQFQIFLELPVKAFSFFLVVNRKLLKIQVLLMGFYFTNGIAGTGRKQFLNQFLRHRLYGCTYTQVTTFFRHTIFFLEIRLFTTAGYYDFNNGFARFFFCYHIKQTHSRRRNVILNAVFYLQHIVVRVCYTQNVACFINADINKTPFVII